MGGWIDTRDRKPLTDGDYLCQTVMGDVQFLSYTTEAGWNTHRDSRGALVDDSVIVAEYVARWYDLPKPPEVPEARVDEWLCQITKRHKEAAV